MTFFEKIYGFFMRAVGGLIATIGGAGLICAGGYTVYVWWGVVNKLDFIGFVLSILFFWISIPLAPLYIGIKGDWMPLIMIIPGVIISWIIFVAGIVILDIGLEILEKEQSEHDGSM